MYIDTYTYVHRYVRATKVSRPHRSDLLVPAMFGVYVSLSLSLSLSILHIQPSPLTKRPGGVVPGLGDMWKGRGIQKR